MGAGDGGSSIDIKSPIHINNSGQIMFKNKKYLNSNFSLEMEKIGLHIPSKGYNNILNGHTFREKIENNLFDKNKFEINRMI